MSRTKKPRKPYRPKPCVMPLGMRNAFDFEMPGLVASMAMGQEHFCEQHVYNLLSNADMVKRTAPADHPIRLVAQEMIYAIADIQNRAQATGKTGVTGDEFRILREGLGKTLVFLRTVSNYDIERAALESVAEFNRYGALRV